MIDFDHQWQSIHDKLQSVLKQYQLLQKENQQLKKELENVRLHMSSKNQQLQKLEQQIDVLKLGVQNWNNEEKQVLKLRIEKYLKEIENCLSLLNA